MHSRQYTNVKLNKHFFGNSAIAANMQMIYEILHTYDIDKCFQFVVNVVFSETVIRLSFN